MISRCIPKLKSTKNKLSLCLRQTIKTGADLHLLLFFVKRKPRDSRVVGKSLSGEKDKKLLMC